MIVEKAARGVGPALDAPLPAVGDRLVARGRNGVAVGAGDIRGADQTGDFGGDRRGGEAVLLFPTFRWSTRSLSHDVISDEFQRLPRRRVVLAQLPGQNDRKRVLVELLAAPQIRVIQL